MKKIILLCAIFSLLTGIAIAKDGTLTFPDGSKYVGQVKDGKPHGQGTLTFPGGYKYEGQFKNGAFHGHGTMTWSDGGKYEGQWSDGAFHGYGVSTNPDGTSHENETYTDPIGIKWAWVIIFILGTLLFLVGVISFKKVKEWYVKKSEPENEKQDLTFNFSLEDNEDNSNMSFDLYKFSHPGLKEIGNIIFSTITQQMDKIQYDSSLSFNQLKIIIKKDILPNVTETLLCAWGKSVEQDEHIIVGVNEIKEVLLIISCFPASTIAEARSKYMFLRYPYMVSHILKQTNHNILEKGFIHVLFSQDKKLRQYNLDYFSLPALNTMHNNPAASSTLIMPRADYFTGNDLQTFNVVLTSALIKDGIINEQAIINGQTKAISEEIVIDKPANTIWSLITNEKKWNDWNEAIIENISKWGVRGKIEWKEGGTSEILIFEKNKHLSIDNYHVIRDIFLAELENGTLVTIMETAQRGTFWSNAGFEQREVLKDKLVKLKRLLDT